jgi:hypothetical protein
MPKTLPDTLREPIGGIDAAKAWIDSLIAADMMFHFEDSPDDIIQGLSGERLFSDADADIVSERVGELYALDWGTFDCPIGYALDQMEKAGML